MATFEIAADLYPEVSPTGAYFCVGSKDTSPVKNLLQKLLAQKTTKRLTETALLGWTNCSSSEDAFELLYQVQRLGWVNGSEQQRVVESAALEDVLPEMLVNFSSEGKALLADSEGFYIARSGFTHESSVELAALSADLANLHERHAGLIDNNFNGGSHSWGLLDRFGSSKLGFWPLYIGSERFVLSIAGRPILNHPLFSQLIAQLMVRYGDIEEST